MGYWFWDVWYLLQHWNCKPLQIEVVARDQALITSDDPQSQNFEINGDIANEHVFLLRTGSLQIMEPSKNNNFGSGTEVLKETDFSFLVGYKNIDLKIEKISCTWFSNQFTSVDSGKVCARLNKL